MIATIPIPMFSIGDIVTRKPFADCFGRRQDRTPPMVVVRCYLVQDGCSVASHCTKPYHRVHADRLPGDTHELQSISGAERFFELA